MVHGVNNPEECPQHRCYHDHQHYLVIKVLVHVNCQNLSPIGGPSGHYEYWQMYYGNIQLYNSSKQRSNRPTIKGHKRRMNRSTQARPITMHRSNAGIRVTTSEHQREKRKEAHIQI